MNKLLQKPALTAFVILCISWLMIRAGILIGTAMVQPGEGFTQKTGIQTDLFRFDAEYYFAIATEGYSYSGDPASSPNIVFAPLYPALIWLVSSVPGVSEVTAGFALNKIFFFLALTFLFQYLTPWLGTRRAFWTLTALATAAGAYSFHAYYSESTMLLFISLILLAHQRRNFPLLAFAACAVGASRLAALPMVAVAAVYLLRQRRIGLALVSVLGSTAYLSYLAATFGNPFQLLPEIQNASWGFFHPETAWFKVLSGWSLLSYAWDAAGRGFITVIDIKTVNLVWTVLALASVIYSFKKSGPSFFNFLFAAYFGFVYLTGASSDFLISAHRFYALMLPIFVMFSGLARNWTVAGLLILLNVFYGLMHTAFFNQGIWFYF